MELEEVNRELHKINNYLKKFLWMDFEFCRMNAGQVILSGSIDQSSNEYAIDIEFESPYFISTLLLWHMDPTKVFIELANDDEINELNQKYNIEAGNYVFKINTEGEGYSTITIIAKKILVRILNETPFLTSGN